MVLLRRGAGWQVGETNRGVVQGWQMAGVKGGDGVPTLDLLTGVCVETTTTMQRGEEATRWRGRRAGRRSAWGGSPSRRSRT